MEDRQPYLETAAVKLPKDLLEQVDRLAQEQDRTRSAMIRRLLKQALESPKP